jgi:large subunit ribosomal protein L29
MLSATEVRALSPDDRRSRLTELKRELMQERGVQAMGGSTPSPGKIRTLRREIARILTIDREIQLGIRATEPKK